MHALARTVGPVHQAVHNIEAFSPDILTWEFSCLYRRAWRFSWDVCPDQLRCAAIQEEVSLDAYHVRALCSDAGTS